MPQRYLNVLLAIAAVSWLLLLTQSGISIPAAAFFKPFTAVQTVVAVAMTLFDLWAWRWRIWRPWFVSQPYLQGTWRGQVIATWRPPAGGEPLAPIEAYLFIRQTFTSIWIRQVTAESTSDLLSGQVVRKPNGIYTVAGVYLNTPNLSIRERSPIHHGATLLEVRGDPPNALEGQYWTDRNTRGEMCFTLRTHKVVDNYAAATAISA